MKEHTIGFAMCGSFCTFARALAGLEDLREVYPNLIPILSEASNALDTRFGQAADFRKRIEALCGHAALTTLTEVEPIGPKKLLDALVIAPCTGNTLAKLANGIADSTVTLAAKAHLRNGRPVILAISSNDALAGNAKNLGTLLARHNFYFVPFGQDDAIKKPTSLVADMTQLRQTLDAALAGRQLQPMLICRT